MNEKTRGGELGPVGLKIAAVLSVIVLTLAVYLFWFRPDQLTWGSREEEIQRVMPGDELHQDPDFLATRGVSIRAAPDRIWPWLIQMGHGRAGFYGYDLLENIGSPRGIRSADRVIPSLQDFQAGDDLPISSLVTYRIAALKADQYVVWAGEGEDPGVFAWVLYPQPDGSTRLVSRVTWSYHPGKPGSLALEVFTEFADHLAVRKILQGIKDRVEGEVEPFWIQNLELFSCLLAGLVFGAALLILLFRPLSWSRWLAALGAGATWLVVWYGGIPFWAGITLGALAVYAVCRLGQNTAES
jgi:hypothetical protein